MAEKAIGKISHVFGKIDVGVVDLTGGLKVGDTIKVKGGDREFEQVVSSIQVEREPVESASAGQSVGMKFDEKIREGDAVYKVA